MTKENYSKPPLSYQQQFERLSSRGLSFEGCEEKALHLLEKLSYYRLSGYWYTLLANPKTNHRFKADAHFNQAFELYKFDRELRLLILNQIEKIEVAIRAVISYECSHSWGVFWLSDTNNFKSHSQHTRDISKMFNEVNRSNELFITNYKNKYIEELPPSWMALEVCSFGSLSYIYSNLKGGRTKRNISQKFGLRDDVFVTWLHTLVYIRNTCAHHSRLWNKNLKIKATVPEQTSLDWIVNCYNMDTRTQNRVHIKKRTYFVLCMLKYLLQSVNPRNSFKEKLDDLFTQYPLVDRKALGYTDDWETEPLWQ
ncbi:Abi family protein [Mariniflexile sp. AS56]|uniref:Abi family protein n=1 Tax=Mariniflexile sp. AS56 TaxID=3063957 RepID=UPI0026F255F1|nr:Abi family protein [Mariniflexile sp. AS56]MDO7174155.1 Abi family protein [Mariniflexile sp. AS56]